MAGEWIIEVERSGGFETYATGNETAAKAKTAAARSFKNERRSYRCRVVFEGEGPTVIYETVFRPGERAKWLDHPGNL